MAEWHSIWAIIATELHKLSMAKIACFVLCDFTTIKRIFLSQETKQSKVVRQGLGKRTALGREHTSTVNF